MKVRQSSTSLRFAGQQVRYVWRKRGSARSGRGWSSSKRGCCCPSMSRPRLRCRCCFHVPKLASCQLELLLRRHARNQLTCALDRVFLQIHGGISSLTEKKSLNLFTSYNMYTKGLVNSRRRKKRARDARTILFSSSRVLHTGQRRNLRRQKQKKKKSQNAGFVGE